MSKKRKSPVSPHRIELPLIPTQSDIDEKAKKPPVIPHLDGFRGFCAILVVISHVGFDVGRPLSTGSDTIAVPGFFILSSFLLTGRLISEFESLFDGTNSEYRNLEDSSNSSPGRLVQKIRKGLVVVACYGVRRVLRIYPLYLPVAFFAPGLRGPPCSSTYDLLTLRSTGPCHLWTIPPEMKNYIFIPLQAMTVAYKPWLIFFWILFFVYTEINWSALRNFNIYVHRPEDLSSLPEMTKIFLEYVEPKLVQSFYPLFLYGFLIRFVYRWWDPWAKPLLQQWLSLPIQILVQTRIPGMKRTSLATILLRTFDLILCLGSFFGYMFMLPRYNVMVEPDKIFNGPGYVAGTLLLISTLMPVDSWLIKPFNFWGLRYLGKISFGWYMTHRFVATWLVDRLPFMQSKYQFELIFIIVLATCLFAHVVYYVIEKPGIALGNWLCRKIESLSGDKK